MAYSSLFEIHLVRNEYLFTDDYLEMYDDVVLDDNGRSIASEEGHCYYLSSPSSPVQASLSLCDNQIQGFVTRSSLNYIIRFDHEESSHCIYRESDLPKTNLRCGNTEFTNQFREFQRNEFEHLQPKVVSSARSGIEYVKYVEWVLVVDSSAFKNLFKSDRVYLRNEVKKMLNHMHGMYWELQFHILLKSLIVWTEKDRIKPDSRLDPFVRNFIRYNEEIIYPKMKQDTSSLLTARDFKEKDLLGFSTKGFTCNAPEIAAGVAVYKSDMSIEFFSIIVAHEMGHTLGFDDEYYDPKGNCYRGCEDELCIMSGQVTKPAHKWSKCTQDIVKRRMKDDRYDCLFNIPISNSSAIPICKNGVVEAGEECDCARTDLDCHDCCNNCKLTEGSECSSGTCCQSCKIIPKEVDKRCRSPRDLECDFEDYCDGVSEHCPDTFRPNFISTCDVNTKWCVDGFCEFKCLYNCSKRGSCVEKKQNSSSLQDKYECECNTPHYGTFCQHNVNLQRILLFHLISGFILFIISFLISYVTIAIVGKFTLRNKT